MQAVNLIPRDLRRGGVGSPGRSGTGVYVVLGTLTALVVMVGAYVLAGNTVTSKRSELTKVKTESQHTAGLAASLKPYQDFATLSQTRLQTVSQLAASRFDWDGTIGQIARVLPARAQINTLKGTINPQVQIDSSGGGGETSSVRATSQDPAIEISGCAPNQTQVALLMSRLRLVDGTRRVTLVSSEKADATATSTAPTTGSASGCPSNRALYQLVMFFAPLGGPATTPGSGATNQPVPAPPTSADVGGPSGAAGTQPVSTGTTP